MGSTMKASENIGGSAMNPGPPGKSLKDVMGELSRSNGFDEDDSPIIKGGDGLKNDETKPKLALTKSQILFL